MHGPYRLVRHPLMTGLLLCFWCASTFTAGHLLWAGGLTGYILLGTFLEERDLVARFGAAYRAYAAQVPAFFSQTVSARRITVGPEWDEATSRRDLRVSIHRPHGGRTIAYLWNQFWKLHARVLRRVAHYHWFGVLAVHVVTPLDRAVIKASRGRLSMTGPEFNTMLLTTTGRKSGKQHTIPVAYVRDGKKVVAVSSNVGLQTAANWPKNLLADPRGTHRDLGHRCRLSITTRYRRRGGPLHGKAYRDVALGWTPITSEPVCATCSSSNPP